MAEKSTASKKAPAKKTATKKSATKKTATRKATTKKAAEKQTSAAKQAPAQRTSAAKATAEAPRRESSSRSTRRDDRALGGGHMASAARDIVLGLTGKTPEAVTGLERSEDGWRVAVDVLELERIPSTTDVLATYEVTLDGQGELQGCRRVHRYLRGTPGDE